MQAVETRPDQRDYIDLVVAIIESGCQPRNPRHPSRGGEGEGYLTTPGGRYWCRVIDVDPAYLLRRAAQAQRRR